MHYHLFLKTNIIYTINKFQEKNTTKMDWENCAGFNEQ